MPTFASRPASATPRDLFGGFPSAATAALPRDAADSEALLRLVACGGATAPRRLLLERAGPAAALAAGAPLWRSCGLVEHQVAGLLAPAPPGLQSARDWLAGAGHQLLGWHDPDYPPLLRRSPNPPLALFVAGDPALLWHPAIAIVGSRTPSPAGRENAAGFARALGATGLMVASGLAAGIDTAVHHATLAAGVATVAVLGTGPDVPYPHANRALHGKISEHGAIVSEHLPGTGPRREHFPTRNRILAGLALGTLVIEAAYRSGALITARLAAECGREVMALPGSIHNPMARGCHRLIRDGAALVERPQDVIDALAPVVAELAADLRLRLTAPSSKAHAACPGSLHDPERGPTAPLRDRPRGEPEGANGTPNTQPDRERRPDHDEGRDHHTLWCALGHDPTSMDQLVERTGLTTARLSSMLLLMELEGRVAAQHGRYFRNR